MSESSWTIELFDEHRGRLRAVAYRMLGSLSDADDAVQETWLRVERADTDDIANPAGWLTTITARVCLNMLRSRTTRREEPLMPHVPDPVITFGDGADPEYEALLADSVGLALMTVLQTLEPAERLAFILHDTFAVSFDEIAPLVGRSVEASRQLASRARNKVRGTTATPDPDLPRQHEVVAAFFAAARGGRFDDLVALLAPDVVLRSDGGPRRPTASALVHGAEAVAGRAIMFSLPKAILTPVLINGAAGVTVTAANGRPISVMAFTIEHGLIVAVDVLADPDRLRTLPGLHSNG